MLIKNDICLECGLTNIRSEIQAIIRNQGIKQAQIEWEETKRDIEEWKRQEPSLSNKLKEMIQTVENDLYPEQKNKGSVWIWFIVLGGIVVIGLIGLIWWKKRKKKGIK